MYYTHIALGILTICFVQSNLVNGKPTNHVNAPKDDRHVKMVGVATTKRPAIVIANIVTVEPNGWELTEPPTASGDIGLTPSNNQDTTIVTNTSPKRGTTKTTDNSGAVQKHKKYLIVMAILITAFMAAFLGYGLYIALSKGKKAKKDRNSSGDGDELGPIQGSGSALVKSDPTELMVPSSVVGVKPNSPAKVAKKVEKKVENGNELDEQSVTDFHTESF